MDDLISRQDAIDALGEKPLVWDDLSDFDLGKAAQWSDDVDAIKALPSAQPEIIRCKDCKYSRMTVDGDCKYCDIWFPDEAEYMDGNYYCGSAERREDENKTSN